ncbi:probable auxin efflux carrier component 1d isoform X4 [Macadamia integrifolia]|uniref:probable auxin efflux carrier component 1d isoform X4 n=1 Tax=Macadamia integrifolia TaxID=60698 RepID=UPI001C4E6FA3|nr:probable auxin efflux carrier component 1d isoform X4 [Macadamia integrifolia]
MISLSDLYCVLTAVVPLYVTMLLAYFSVKWWKIFTPDQCAGINRFVAIFAVPLLSFEFISRINPYKMDLLFIAADTISKLVILFVLFSWAKFSKRGSLDWAITLFSLSTLPNTLVMGIPLLKSMYGDDKEAIMIQAVVLQCVVWYTLMLFLFEYRAARILIHHKFINGITTGTINTERNMDNQGGLQKLGGGRGGEDENFNKVVPDSRGTTFNPIVAAAAAEEDGKEFHLFIWRCRCCSSEGVCEQSVQACHKEEGKNSTKKKDGEEETPDAIKVTEYSSSISSQILRQILKIVWFKLVRNPNSYASILGLSWALASCWWGIKKPQIMENSVTILSKAGLGMAMFSLGLFMALQPRIIACGKRLTAYGMLVRFVAGPAVMAVASIGVGLRGTILKVSIVQAALPQGIVPFVFAREYNLHPDMLSTAVIFGMIVSLPITVLYYILLGL